MDEVATKNNMEVDSRICPTCGQVDATHQSTIMEDDGTKSPSAPTREQSPLELSYVDVEEVQPLSNEERARVVDAIIAVIYEQLPPPSDYTHVLEKIYQFLSGAMSEENAMTIFQDLDQSIQERYDYYLEIAKTEVSKSTVFSLLIQDWEESPQATCCIGININCRIVVDDIAKVASIGFEIITQEPDPLFKDRFLAILMEWGINPDSVEKVIVDVNPLVANVMSEIFGGDRVMINSIFSFNSVAMRPFAVPGPAQKIFQLLMPYSHGTDPRPECIELLKEFSRFSTVKYSSYDQHSYPLSLLDDVREVLTVYAPIKLLFEEFERKGVIPTSEIIPLVGCLMSGLAQTRPLTKWGERIKETVYKGINGWFTLEYHQSLTLPTLLDPRFKGECFDNKTAVKQTLDTLQEKVHDTLHQGIWHHSRSDRAKKLVDNYMNSETIAIDMNPFQYYTKYHKELRPVADKYLILAEIYPPVVRFSGLSAMQENTMLPHPNYSLKRHLFFASVMGLIDNKPSVNQLANDIRMALESSSTCPSNGRETEKSGDDDMRCIEVVEVE